jgi:hypothetical protein
MEFKYVPPINKVKLNALPFGNLFRYEGKDAIYVKAYLINIHKRVSLDILDTDITSSVNPKNYPCKLNVKTGVCTPLSVLEKLAYVIPIKIIQPEVIDV